MRAARFGPVPERATFGTSLRRPAWRAASERRGS